MHVGMVFCTTGKDRREARVVEVGADFCTAEMVDTQAGEGDVLVGSEMTEKN